MCFESKLLRGLRFAKVSSEVWSLESVAIGCGLVFKLRRAKLGNSTFGFFAVRVQSEKIRLTFLFRLGIRLCEGSIWGSFEVA